MLCEKCEYIERVGYLAGQGFMKWTCKNCGKEFWHENTAVPMYCKECSEKLQVCESCGATL